MCQHFIRYNPSSSTATPLRNVIAISKLTFEQPNVDLILTVNRPLVSVVIHCIALSLSLSFVTTTLHSRHTAKRVIITSVKVKYEKTNVHYSGTHNVPVPILIDEGCPLFCTLQWCGAVTCSQGRQLRDPGATSPAPHTARRRYIFRSI